MEQGVATVPWQLSFFFGSMCLVLHDWTKFTACAIVWIFCTIGLYFFWYKQLRDPEETGEAAEERAEAELRAR